MKALGASLRINLAASLLTAAACLLTSDNPASRITEKDSVPPARHSIEASPARKSPDLPSSSVRNFILAGGKITSDNAVWPMIIQYVGDGKIAVFTAAYQEDEQTEVYNWYRKFLTSSQSSGKALHEDQILDLTVHSREEACSESKLSLLDQSVKLILGTGGRQDRGYKKVKGTRLETKIKELLNRGVCWYGNSATTSMVGTIMPMEDKIVEGMGFLDGCIDQHIDARPERSDRMIKSKRQYPNKLCMGIAENTAAIMQVYSNKIELKVIGTGYAAIVNLNGNGETAVTKIEAGQSAHLLHDGGNPIVFPSLKSQMSGSFEARQSIAQIKAE